MILTRIFLFLFFIGPLSLCCATVNTSLTKPLTADVPHPEPIPLIGLSGGGHACPVVFNGEPMIITAKHVAFRKVILVDGSITFLARPWNAEINGKVGTVYGLTYHNFVDIAIVQSNPLPTKYYPTTMELPSEGEVLYWNEYNFKTAKKAYKPLLRSAEVTNVLADHIFLGKPPTPGASGTCVYNENFEVVGIVSFGQGMRDASAISGIVSIRHIKR